MSPTPDEVLKVYDTSDDINALDWPNALRAALKQRDEARKWTGAARQLLVEQLAERDRQLATALKYIDSICDTGRAKGVGFCIAVAGLARVALAQIKGEGK